jgi:hypothetical protein
MDAVYIISPKPHIVDCMMAEFDQRRYRGFFLIWTTCENAADSGTGAGTDALQYYHHNSRSV